MAFSREWDSEASERAESQSFWNDFFRVFGISRRAVAAFEAPVRKLTGHLGKIDLFWNRADRLSRTDFRLVHNMREPID